MKYLKKRMKTFATVAFALVAYVQSAHAVDIVRSNGQWMVRRNDGVLVSCSNNIFRGIEIGVGLLNAGRTSKETIRLLAPAGTYAVSGGPANLRTGTGNFILDLGAAQGVRLNVTGGGVANFQNRNNFDIRNLNMIGGTTGITLFTKMCNNVIFENIAIAGSNSSIGIRPEGTWQENRYVTGIQVRGTCTFSGMSPGNHAIETMAVDGFTAPTKITTNNTGGAGILLNMTRNSNITHLHATRASYNPDSASNYAAYRLANNCAFGKPCYLKYLESYTCGRGFVVTTSENITRAEVHNVLIEGSANFGIGISTSPDNVFVNSGRSNNNIGNGLDIGDATNCTFTDLQLRGNDRRGLEIDAPARGLRLIRVDVDDNAWASEYTSANFADTTGSDLVN